MPWNSGVFTRVHNWVNDRDNLIKIKADRHDAEDDNLAAGLNLALLKDGTNSATANLNLGSQKITNLANGTTSTDAATFGQIPTDIMLLDGTNTMAGDMKLGAKKITGLANGVLATDAATVGQLSGSDLSTVMLLNGTQAMTASLPMGANRITGLATGIANSDAVNVLQLPAKIEAGAGRPFGLLEGGLWVKIIDATEWQLLMKHGTADINVSTMNIEDNINQSLDSLTTSVEALESQAELLQTAIKTIGTSSTPLASIPTVFTKITSTLDITLTAKSATSTFIVDFDIACGFTSGVDTTAVFFSIHYTKNGGALTAAGTFPSASTVTERALDYTLTSGYVGTLQVANPRPKVIFKPTHVIGDVFIFSVTAANLTGTGGLVLNKGGGVNPRSGGMSMGTAQEFEI